MYTVHRHNIRDRPVEGSHNMYRSKIIYGNISTEMSSLYVGLNSFCLYSKLKPEKWTRCIHTPGETVAGNLFTSSLFYNLNICRIVHEEERSLPQGDTQKAMFGMEHWL
jgi:hypothetical protein